MKPTNGLPAWASLVFVLGPEGKTVLVFDNGKKNPKWKLPGGKNQLNESPEETAVRELCEETGIKVPVSDLILLKEVDKSQHSTPHSLFVFVASVNTFDGLLEVGDENEIVGLFDLRLVPKMPSLFAEHWAYIKGVYEDMSRLQGVARSNS